MPLQGMVKYYYSVVAILPEYLKFREIFEKR
uniref:Uncharacterized protein n=1 Tax=uncultured gamma proteobacterium HF0200_34B07 TaxID=723571 RepID=E7C428_9GAMM|nr:hypothetical protein [uncultured gamma proteobacterium HF0200_34B07]